MIIDVFGRRENPVSTVCGSALMKTPLILSAWGQQGSCMCNTCLCLNSCCTGSESHKSVFHPSTPCSVEMKEELIKNRWEDAPCNIYIYLAVGRDTEEEVKLNSNCIDYKTLSLPVNSQKFTFFFFFYIFWIDLRGILSEESGIPIGVSGVWKIWCGNEKWRFCCFWSSADQSGWAAAFCLHLLHLICKPFWGQTHSFCLIGLK